jgi:hypothetical protein
MRQPMFAKPIWRFLLGKVLTRTGTIDLMIDGLAIGLAGNTAFPVEDVSEVLVCYSLGVYESQSNPQRNRVTR